MHTKENFESHNESLNLSVYLNPRDKYTNTNKQTKKKKEENCSILTKLQTGNSKKKKKNFVTNLFLMTKQKRQTWPAKRNKVLANIDE